MDFKMSTFFHWKNKRILTYIFRNAAYYYVRLLFKWKQDFTTAELVNINLVYLKYKHDNIFKLFSIRRYANL
ncbi:hypothetical protein MERGE_000603 [Pneumocystis wakefieldiae]|uniref:Uncharacterized protein n=1 Tax=Pneumocystis wakefieldiae TaxID=38082 RepID=A0A899G4H0_9ASCO|nr:hypothetical protein MERGE_000603 [Pneumocystis wakefieldiae]